MHFDPENTQRTVWSVTDRLEFFEKMRALLNVGEDDAKEIAEQLQERNFDYLEIAAYLPGSESEDPDATLVFDGKKDVYWDIFNTEKIRGDPRQSTPSCRCRTQADAYPGVDAKRLAQTTRSAIWVLTPV